ncbi:MAG TPA: TPM domain-containing protein [Casimicrobiaceae bacterium]|nr:TPM domain-containing protein [Casimicrobiaceae bacterium]
MAASRPGRLLRHIAGDHRSVRRAFPDRALAAIQAAIAAGERRHRGQVCVAIEGSLPPVRVLRRVTPRERALEVFGLLRVWDTEENAGVLLYVLLADRDVEIVADRGIHRRVGDAEWEAVCRALEANFRSGDQADGMVRAVGRISDLLAEHFPGDGSQTNELPDRPAVL